MTQKNKAATASRHRYTFGDNFPIRDATANDGKHAVVVQERDWRLGIKDDPRRCAYARAIQRALGLPPPEKVDMGLAVYGTVAYVPVPNPAVPKKWEVLRYFIEGRAHKRWDRGEQVEPQVVTLVPPTAKRRLDAKKQYRKPAGAPSRRPHKKTGYKACGGVRGGLYHHHQTQILGALSAVVMACVSIMGARADDGRRDTASITHSGAFAAKNNDDLTQYFKAIQAFDFDVDIAMQADKRIHALRKYTEVQVLNYASDRVQIRIINGALEGLIVWLRTCDIVKDVEPISDWNSAAPKP